MPEKAKTGAGTALMEPDPIPDTSTNVPTSVATTAEDEIAARAYSYWEARGCEGGSADEDWYRAIEELERE